ncbi:MAG: hypothetical protein ACRCYO_13850, partial [Bacteroidia bacterium]
MFRLCYVLFFLSMSLFAKAQVESYWIYDTAHVVCFYAKNRAISDTVAYLRTPIDSSNAERITIYWDKEEKHKYEELVKGKRDSMITYYRNGQINEAVYFVDKNGASLGDLYLWNAWYADGVKKGERVFSETHVSEIYYHHNRKVCSREVSIIKSHPLGQLRLVFCYTEHFCENGQLIFADSTGAKSTRTV